MKLRVFNSLFDEVTFLKIPARLWKYIAIIWVLLKLILQKTLYTIFPTVLIYILIRIFTHKDKKMLELLVNHYKDKNKYYNP